MKNTDFNLEKFNKRITAELIAVNGQLDLIKRQFESAQYNYIKLAYRIEKYSITKKYLDLLNDNVNKQFSFIGTERFRREKEMFFFEEQNEHGSLIKELVTTMKAMEASLNYINFIKDRLMNSLIEQELMNSSSICSNLEALAEREAFQELINIISPINKLKEGIL